MQPDHSWSCVVRCLGCQAKSYGSGASAPCCFRLPLLRPIVFRSCCELCCRGCWCFCALSTMMMTASKTGPAINSQGGPNEFFLKPRHWWVGGFSGTGDCRPRSPSGAIIIAEIHAWIRDREQVKIKGFIRTAAKLYNCVGAPVSALKDRQCFSTLQPKRVVQFLAQQHTRLCDASDAAPEASFPLLGSFSALVPVVPYRPWAQRVLGHLKTFTLLNCSCSWLFRHAFSCLVYW